MDGVHPALELGWNLLPAAAEELRSPGRHLAWSPGTLGCCGELVPTSPVLAIQCPLSAAVKLLLSPPHISEPQQQPHPALVTRLRVAALRCLQLPVMMTAGSVTDDPSIGQYRTIFSGCEGEAVVRWCWSMC